MKRVPAARKVVSFARHFNGLRSAGIACLVAAVATFASARAQAQEWPASLKADYDVGFNGFNIGSFTFQAEAERQSYTITGNASLSMLLGAISWKSDSRSFGSISDKLPRPAEFSIDMQSGSKALSTRMGFDEGAVQSIAHMPAMPPKTDIVPLREQHLRGVVDPLSAMMMLAASNAPCDRRIPVFDGRERYDLVFSRKGETRLSEQTPSGQPGVGYLCRVRYVPIAGHKADDNTRYMAENRDIEVVLRPIPSAHMYVPYQVSIPTPMGTATLTSKRVEIAQAGKPRIALLH